LPSSAPEPGLAGLFNAAFTQSRNPMLLVDEARCIVDANGAFVSLLGYRREQLVGVPTYTFVAGGPLATPAEWRAQVADGRFAGEAELVRADGAFVGVQFAGTSEVVTGRRLVLFVALSTSRWGSRFRRSERPVPRHAELSRREVEIVALVALGSTGPEIAEELRISHDTVRTHVRNAMDKLDARSRAHLVARALGEGLVLGQRGVS
jgi:PAS domain S-box-containing protein